MPLNLSREGYLEQRLTKGRVQIAKEQNVPYAFLLKQIEKWKLGNLDEENDMLERMRASRGLPGRLVRATEDAHKTAAAGVPTASQSGTSTNALVQKTAEVLVEPSVLGGIDLSKVKWVTPIAVRTVSPVGFNAHGLRVSGWVAEKLTATPRVQVGFLNGLIVVNPTTSYDAWRVKHGKSSTCYIGSKKIVQAAREAGVKLGAELKPEWHPQGFLIIRTVG